MIEITKADVGRKALRRDGGVTKIVGFEDPVMDSMPVHATPLLHNFWPLFYTADGLLLKGPREDHVECDGDLIEFVG